jgi:hypothetical protein
MHRKDAIAWVVSVCSVSLRLSQARTLAILVAAAATPPAGRPARKTTAASLRSVGLCSTESRFQLLTPCEP